MTTYVRIIDNRTTVRFQGALPVVPLRIIDNRTTVRFPGALPVVPLRIIDNRTTVRFPGALPVVPLTLIQQAVDALETAGHVYDSDESAAIGGIELGEVYLTANNHVQAPGGLLKIRLL